MEIEDERLKVKFYPKTTKLVSITPEKDGQTLVLKKYQGLDKKSEARIEIEEETTVEGIKSVIEDFRAM